MENTNNQTTSTKAVKPSVADRIAVLVCGVIYLTAGWLMIQEGVK